MNTWIIKLVGLELEEFVSSYSNTLAQALTTCRQDNAKKFDTQPEAKKWASAYLTGYRWVIIPYTPVVP